MTRRTDLSVIGLAQRKRTFTDKESSVLLNRIIAKIITVLSGATSWSLEDLSTDSDVDVTPLYCIFLDGIDHEEGFGGAPLYLEALIMTRVVRNDAAPADARDSQATIVHQIRDALTVAALNIGDFATSKIISRVHHAGVDVDYNPPISTIDYELKIRYREEGT